MTLVSTDAMSDLEDAINRAKAAAKTLELVLEAFWSAEFATESKTPGVVQVVLRHEDIDAARDVVTTNLERLEVVYSAWERVFREGRVKIPLSEVAASDPHSPPAP